MSADTLILSKGVDVDIQRASIAAATGGGQVHTWSSVGSARVFIQPSSGGESIRYGGESSRRFHQAFARIGCGIRDGDRLVWGARVYDVQIHNTPGEFTSGPLSHVVLDLEETNTSQ